MAQPCGFPPYWPISCSLTGDGGFRACGDRSPRGGSFLARGKNPKARRRRREAHCSASPLRGKASIFACSSSSGRSSRFARTKAEEWFQKVVPRDIPREGTFREAVGACTIPPPGQGRNRTAVSPIGSSFRGRGTKNGRQAGNNICLTYRSFHPRRAVWLPRGGESCQAPSPARRMTDEGWPAAADWRPL